MANKTIRATAELFLNTKQAQKDAKEFVNDLKGKLQDIETAADKMTVFKDMVAYIAQVDRALSALKANNKETFSSMFDGLDANLKKQLEGIFGVDGLKLGQLDILREQLGGLTLGSSIKDIRSFAKEINALFTSIGTSAPFDDIDKIFNGRTTSDHLQKLGIELANFAKIWQNVNTSLAGEFGFGSGSQGSSPDNGGILSEVEMLINNLQKKNKELIDAKERFDKILEEFHNVNTNGISDNYKIDLTEESIKNLTVEYDRLQGELENADASSDGFYNTLTKLVEVSLRLKKAFADVSSDEGLKSMLMNASAGAGTGESTLFGLLSRYARTKDPVNKDIQRLISRGGIQTAVNANNALIEELRASQDINAVIQKRVDLYNQLSTKLREYDELQRQEFDTDEEEDENLDKLTKIEQEIKTITKSKNSLESIQGVLAELSEDGAVLDTVLQKLYKTLGMETPDVFKKRLENLVAESKAAMAAIEGERDGSGAGGPGSSRAASGGTVAAEVDFTSLENTIKSEFSSIADKLDGSTFKVELVSDQTKDIQGVVNDILSVAQRISDNSYDDKSNAEIDSMKKNLLQLLDVVNAHNAGITSDGEYQRQELSAALLSDGGFSVNYGDKGRVAWGHVAENLIGNLNKTLLADIHSHPLRKFLSDGQMYANDAFSGSSGDLGAFNFSKALGAQLAGMITGNILRVLDVSSIPSDVMTRMNKELAAIEQQYLNSGKYSQYIGRSPSGKIAAVAQDTLEGQHEVTKVFESMMYDALKRVGYSESYIDNQLFKKYNLTDDAQLTDLASRLVQLVSSAEQAAPPVQRLAEIVQQFGYDSNSKEAKVLFEAYNKGELKASDVFNKLSTDGDRVSEAAIQSLLRIDSANQTSQVETLLTNISTILSGISTLVGNIEASTKLDGEQQLNNAINTLSDLKAGIISSDLNKGIDHIYNDKDATNYRYQDVAMRALTATHDFVDDLKIKRESDGFTLSESALKDALDLVNKFKTAFTYLQDFGKQADLFTGGRNNLGLYVDPNDGKILDTYDTLSETLLNPNVLDALIGQLKAIQDNEFNSNDSNVVQQLQSSIERLSNVIDNLSSAMSNFGESSFEKVRSNSLNLFDEDNLISESQNTYDIDALRSKVEGISGEIRGLAADVRSSVTDVAQSSVIGTEIALLESLEAQLLLVKTAIDNKTRAFEEEYVTVDSIIQYEISSLQDLLNKLEEIAGQINLVSDSLTKINNTSLDVNANKNAQETDKLINDLNVTSEVDKLNKFKDALVEVKNAILSKTKAFYDEGVVVSQVIGKEIAALKQLSTIVDDLTPKMNSLVSGLTSLKNGGTIVKSQGSNVSYSNTKKTTATKDAPVEDLFKKSLNSQKTSFDSYRKELESVDYVSTELREELDQLAVKLQQVTDAEGLKKFGTEFDLLQNKIAAKKNAFDTYNLGNVNNAINQLRNLFNGLTFEQQSDVDQSYKDALDILGQYQITIKNGHAVELKSIHEVVDALRQKLEKYKEANKEAKKAAAITNNSKFGDTASINASAKYNSLKEVANHQFANSREVQESLNQYTAAYNHFIDIRNRLRNIDGDISSDDKEEFKAAKDACNEYAKALDRLIKNSQKAHNEKINPDYMLGSDFDYTNIEGRKTALAEFAQEVYGVSLSTENFDKNFSKAMFTVKNSDGTLTQMTATFTEARNEIVAMAGATKKTTGLIGELWGQFKGKIKSIFTYLTASFSLHEAWSVVRQGVQYVREIDSALTELKKVTNETDASYQKFLKDMAKTGSVVGATVKDLTTIAADWSRLGFSMKEAGELAKSTAILLNVSEFTDANAASEALISTMQAFQYTADESQHVVDILNEIGKFIACR